MQCASMNVHQRPVSPVLFSTVAGIAIVVLHRGASALGQSVHMLKSRVTQTPIVCHAESMLQWQG